MKLAVAVLSAALALPAGRVAAQETGAAIRSVPVEGAVVRVDGRLDEDAWASAARLVLPWEVHPGNNVGARVPTECAVLHDTEQLYIACTAEDPEPGAVRAFITDRDRTDGHDRIFVSLDPFGDGRRAWEFGVSALGVQHDRLRTDGSDLPDDTWDAIWESAGRITEDGYAVELAIPFRSIRFPESVSTWRIVIEREWPRGAAYRTRSHTWDRAVACRLCQSNVLRGLDGVASGGDVELAPSLVADRIERRGGETASLRAEGVDVEPSLDLQWSPSSNLAVNATLNPDFSQIEADAVQLEANLRFPLSYPEKRPFFLEGADLFQTPLRVVFTRRIVDPSAGAKITGKLGSTAFGVMAVRDGVNDMLLPGPRSAEGISLDDDVSVVIARARRDVGESSTVGALYTGRVSNGYRNHVVGIDARLRPLPSTTLSVQVVRSETRDPVSVSEEEGRPGEPFGGSAAWGSLRWATREWRAGLDAELVRPGFRADAGFVPQVDLRRYQGWLGRDIWSDGAGWFQRFGIRGGAWREESWQGVAGNRGMWAHGEYMGPGQSFLWVSYNRFQEGFAGPLHDLWDVWYGGEWQPSGSLRLSLENAFGRSIDFASDREAGMLRVAPSATGRVGRHLEMRGALSAQRLRIGERTVLDARAAEVRAIWSFTPRLFVRLIAQYRDTERRPPPDAPATVQRGRALDGQLLLSYKVNPLTVVFAGFGAGWDGDDVLRDDLRAASRVVFLKVGYAWRP